VSVEDYVVAPGTWAHDLLDGTPLLRTSMAPPPRRVARRTFVVLAEAMRSAPLPQGERVLRELADDAVRCAALDAVVQLTCVGRNVSPAVRDLLRTWGYLP